MKNLANPTQNLDGVNLEYLQGNYTNTTNSQAYVGTQIAGLSSVYMPIGQTLNNIPANGSVSLSNNRLINLENGVDPQDAVTLN